MRIPWMFLLFGCASWAQDLQRMEFNWMAGGVNTSSSAITGTTAVIAGSAGLATQFGYGFKVASTPAGSLWVEVPFTYTWEGAAAVTGTTVATIDRNVWYFTPGVRLETRHFKRVSFHALAGGGTGSFSKVNSIVNGANGTVIVNSLVQLSPVFDFGAGIDLHLSRHFSLRAQGRDFVSGAHLGGVAGHNHPVVLAGLVIRL